ncbi:MULTISPECIES: prenyltransferase/squalene oxidase repeat-containing protein [unclassified Nocardia]|uniref:prenyltransferase/squalene oxidase repeat-containing protein n=1 Tax=unclassified Nocardia TaxID=2637762 RepID=UPI001CE4053D|nr:MULTISPECIES: prenyltransferase/squalene oxidase repeat-containing protein [unclassified Nocardia]
MTDAITDIDSVIDAGAAALFAQLRPDGYFMFDSGAGATLATAGATLTLHLHDPVGAREYVSRGCAHLAGAQNPDGGWGSVPGQPSEAVTTAIAAAVLHLVSTVHYRDEIDAGRAALARMGGLAGIADPALAAVCGRFHAMAGWVPEQSIRVPLWVFLLPGLRRTRMSFRSAVLAATAIAQARGNPAGGLRGMVDRAAEPAALRLLYRVYEDEGRTGEFGADAWAVAMTAIPLIRSGAATDLVAAMAGYLRRAVAADGSWPIVDIRLTYTGFAATGLCDAGYRTDPRLARVGTAIREAQLTQPFSMLNCPAGGWSYSGPRGWPVTLESAELLAALATLPGAERDPALAEGLRWLAGRQDRRGSWSLWVRDTALPNDGPCPYLTAQAVDALLDGGVPVADRRIRRAVRWLTGEQRADGSFDALWYRGATPGTAEVLGVLARTGLPATRPAVRRATDWLLRHQLPDGSWGDGAAGSVEETAWALRGLLRARVASAAIDRAADWLAAAQLPDGRWPEAPVSAYIRHCVHYPNGAITAGLALRALAAYRRAKHQGAAK